MKRLGVLKMCALCLISQSVRMESYFSVARDSATLFGVGAMTKEDAAPGRWHLRRYFIMSSLLAYLHALPNFVTKPLRRSINLTLSAELASSYHLKALHWCFQARGYTDSRLWVHFGVYFKINVELLQRCGWGISTGMERSVTVRLVLDISRQSNGLTL